MGLEWRWFDITWWYFFEIPELVVNNKFKDEVLKAKDAVERLCVSCFERLSGADRRRQRSSHSLGGDHQS